MSRPEVAVGVESFAAVYVESATRCPPGKQVFKDHRGYYYRLDLQSLDEDDAASVVSKAREQFPVELVRRVTEDDTVTKERRYVSDVSEVPDGYIPERGPQGGVYYETNPTNDPTDQVASPTDPTEDTGYAGQPVLAVHFEDVDEDDRVAFENPDTGERDIGRVDVVDEAENLVRVESGHGDEWVRPETFEVTKAEGDGGDGGTLTSGTEAAHNAVHGGDNLPDECRSCGERDRQEGRLVCAECEERLYKDCDGHHVGSYFNGTSVRLDDDEAYCETEGEVFDAAVLDRGRCPHCGEAVDTAEVEKAAADPGDDAEVGEGDQDVWVYYVGPQGGEGWQNMNTGEVRYQKERPGPGPEGGDGYGDWLGDGWSEPPDDLHELASGQPIEVYDHDAGEYSEQEFHADEVSEDGTEYYPGYDMQITAVGEYDPFENFYEGNGITEEEYFDHVLDHVPEDAGEAARALAVGESYEVELPTLDTTVELPFEGYVTPENPAASASSAGLGVPWDALPEEVQEGVGEPQPFLTLPDDAVEDMVVGFDEVAGEAVEPPDDWVEIDSTDELAEGMQVMYQSQTQDEAIESEVVDVNEQGDVLTAEDHYLWPDHDDFDVWAPEAAEPYPDVDVDEEAEELLDEIEEYEAEGSAEAEPDEGTPAIDWVEAAPEDFNSAVEAFIDDNPEMGAYLTEHPPEELADHQLYLSEDGGAGAAVSPEGDIQNVFNHTGPSGAGEAALQKAIEEGGRTLDCYDGFLPGLYKDNGFAETARQEFVADYAPDALEYDPEDPPDVVFMHYEPEGDTSETSEYIDDWGQAKQLSRDRAVEPGGGDTGGSGGAQERGVGGEESGAHPDTGAADGQTVAEGSVGHPVDRAPEGLYADAGLGDFAPDDVVETYGMDKVNATTGNTVQAKQVAELADGTEVVYTDTSHHMGDPDLGMRAVAGAQFARELFDDYTEHGVPEIDGDPHDGYFFSATAPGEDVAVAPSEYKQAVDPDDFYRQAAIQVMLGNNDAHVNNVKVDEGGGLHWFDMDHAGGSIHNPSALNKSFEYDDGWDRIFGELARTGTGLGLGDETEVRQGIFEQATSLAAELVDDDQLSAARSHTASYNDEFADNIVNNIKDLANGEYPYKPY